MRTLHPFPMAVGLAVLVVASAPGARATGYFFGEMDAVANGRALAVAARLEEPSTVFYNPAGLAFLKGFNLAVGGLAVLPSFGYSDPEGRRPSEKAVFEVTMIPHLYASYTFGESAAVGFGFNAPFGLSLKWPVGFAGEGVSAGVDMKMPTIHVGGAFRPIPQVSVGATLRVVPATLEMLQRFQTVSDAGDLVYGFAYLGANAVGVGGSFGITARPIERLHLGFSYMSRMKFTFKGSGAFYPGDGVSDTSVFHDQGGQAEMVTPDILSFGVGYQFLENLYFEFDFNYTLWSVYKELKVAFDNDPSGVLTSQGVQKKDWKDTPTFRLCGEYRPIPAVAVRLGGGYDVSPAPDSTLGPELPDANRIFVNLGGGYLYAPLGLKIDVAYTLVLFRPRTVTSSSGNPFPATYKTTAHLLGFTAGVHF